MKIIWSPLSLERAEAIVGYIAHDNPAVATQWILQLFKKVRKLEKFPSSGRVVPETQRVDIREIIYGDYRILYQTQKNHVWILTIRHGKQKLPKEEITSWKG